MEECVRLYAKAVHLRARQIRAQIHQADVISDDITQGDPEVHMPEDFWCDDFGLDKTPKGDPEVYMPDDFWVEEVVEEHEEPKTTVPTPVLPEEVQQAKNLLFKQRRLEQLMKEHAMGQHDEVEA
jgi:hypothetical protein